MMSDEMKAEVEGKGREGKGREGSSSHSTAHSTVIRSAVCCVEVGVKKAVDRYTHHVTVSFPFYTVTFLPYTAQHLTWKFELYIGTILLTQPIQVYLDT
jgi:hypothetical protein